MANFPVQFKYINKINQKFETHMNLNKKAYLSRKPSIKTSVVAQDAGKPLNLKHKKNMDVLGKSLKDENLINSKSKDSQSNNNNYSIKS